MANQTGYNFLINPETDQSQPSSELSSQFQLKNPVVLAPKNKHIFPEYEIIAYIKDEDLPLIGICYVNKNDVKMYIYKKNTDSGALKYAINNDVIYITEVPNREQTLKFDKLMKQFRDKLAQNISAFTIHADKNYFALA